MDFAELRENSLGSITDMSLPRTNAVLFSSSASKRLFISYVYTAESFSNSGFVSLFSCCYALLFVVRSIDWGARGLDSIEKD